MNLRDIKKDIEYVVGAFIDDCSLFVTVNPDKKKDSVAKLIEEAVDLYNELRDKVNHPEGKKAVFFVGLRKELLEKTDALYEKLSAVVKNSVEEAPAEEAPKAAKVSKAPKSAPKAEKVEKEKPATKKPAAKKPAAKKAAPKKAEE
jgi:hypothetical protein